MALYKNAPASIGNTPLIKLNHVVDSSANVLVKVEGRNPSYSVKCRIGVSMIDDAEKRGVLNPGGSIVEATSGNTGIALAYVAAARGYKLTLTMPETMSVERRKLFALLGANVVLTPGAAGMGGQGGAIQRAKEIAQAEGAFMPLQFENPANPEIHEKTTGPEIWADTNGGIDVLVAGVGTGGTISGISRYIKKTQSKNIISVAVEPTSSPVISQHLAGQDIKPGPHKIQGIGAGFIPKNLDLSLIDKVVQVDSDEAIAFTRLLAQKEGLLVGISSGASALAAKRLAEQPEFSGKTIVAILPDLAERYISTGLFEGIGA